MKFTKVSPRTRLRLMLSAKVPNPNPAAKERSVNLAPGWVARVFSDACLPFRGASVYLFPLLNIAARHHSDSSFNPCLETPIVFRRHGAVQLPRCVATTITHEVSKLVSTWRQNDQPDSPDRRGGTFVSLVHYQSARILVYDIRHIRTCGAISSSVSTGL